MIRRSHGRVFAPRSGRWPLLGAAAASMALAACNTDSLLQLPDPDIIGSQVVTDTANLPILRNGVQFEFAQAYAGPATNNADPGIVGQSGLLADELWYASTFPTLREIDGRRIDVANGDVATVFRYVHRARNLAERAAELYATTSHANGADHATMVNYAGYTYLFFAENYCSGVPFSTSPFSGELSFGGPNTTADVLDSAVHRFTAALAMSDPTQQNVARIGLGRALLDQGNFAAAAAAVASVPTSFRFVVPFADPPAPSNGVWYNINSEKRASSASQEGTGGQTLQYFDRTVTTSGASATIDPRVPVIRTGTGLGTTTIPHFSQQKYPSRSSAIPLATGIEARLIEAEAALRANNYAGALVILNQLRTDAGMTPLAPAVGATAQQDQLFRERAFWLYLTGHRLSDMRRLIRQYGRTQDQVFPTGTTIFSSQYGTDVNLPIPQVEQNNPEFSGQCLDRNA